MTPETPEGDQVEETAAPAYDGIAMIAEWPPRPETRPAVEPREEQR